MPVTYNLDLVEALSPCDLSSMSLLSCADPERMGFVPIPLKNHKNIGYKQYWSGSLGKPKSYQSSIQCSVTIGPPVKCH